MLNTKYICIQTLKIMDKCIDVYVLCRYVGKLILYTRIIFSNILYKRVGFFDHIPSCT